MSLNLLSKIFYDLFKYFLIKIEIEFQILTSVFLIDLWVFWVVRGKSLVLLFNS